MNELPIPAQLKIAFSKNNIVPTALGAILGSVVPIMVYSVSHEIPAVIQEKNYLVGSGLSLLAIGGCYFSFASVMKWGNLAFNDKTKAVSFAVLLEGMLIMSGIHSPLAWLGIVALSFLALINAISAGCTITLTQKEYRTTIRTSKTHQNASKAAKPGKTKKGEKVLA